MVLLLYCAAITLIFPHIVILLTIPIVSFLWCYLFYCRGDIEMCDLINWMYFTMAGMAVGAILRAIVKIVDRRSSSPICS